MAAKFLKPFRFGKGVLAFVTTRRNGNLSLYTGDDPEKVIANRNKLAKALAITPNKLISADQVHKNRVAIIKHMPASLKHTDAMVTDVPGKCLMLTTADCVPLLFYDPKKKIIGAAHSGWRGTALKIAQRTIKAMTKLGANRKDILVGIGPSIGPCCYEVGPEVSRHFGKKGRSRIDLAKENKRQLIRTGIPSKNIHTVKLCTKCNSDRFFSARASIGPTGRACRQAGRFGTGIMLLG